MVTYGRLGALNGNRIVLKYAKPTQDVLEFSGLRSYFEVRPLTCTSLNFFLVRTINHKEVIITVYLS